MIPSRFEPSPRLLFLLLALSTLASLTSAVTDVWATASGH
jgi:hypothetical protein